MAALSVTIYAGILFGADGITTAFNSEQNPLLQQIAVKGLRIYFAGILFAGFNIVLSFYFTSIEKAVPAQVISLARGLLIIVPLSILLANILGMTGVWMSFPISELLVYPSSINVCLEPVYSPLFLALIFFAPEHSGL